MANQSDVVEILKSLVAVQKDTTKMLGSLADAHIALDTKVTGIRSDIGLLKGGYARSQLERQLNLIAHDLGGELMTEVSPATLIALSKELDGAAKGDVQSFVRADAVLMVTRKDGKPGYMAIEVSYTVGDDDARRAVRNSEFLAQATGLPAQPVVAGVDVLPEVQKLVDEGIVSWYAIPPRDLQPD